MSGDLAPPQWRPAPRPNRGFGLDDVRVTHEPVSRRHRSGVFVDRLPVRREAVRGNRVLGQDAAVLLNDELELFHGGLLSRVRVSV
jgi:hypothetical protein